MNRRRIYEEIALVRKRIFAVSVLAGFSFVAVASLWGTGLDFYRVSVNSALAVIVFGCLGFVAGVIYERLVEGPLIESYREEARRREAALQSDNLEMDLPVAELKPGMTVCQQVNSSEGAMLVRPGAILTERLIFLLKEKGIQTVRVKAHRPSVQSQSLA